MEFDGGAAATVGEGCSAHWDGAREGLLPAGGYSLGPVEGHVKETGIFLAASFISGSLMLGRASDQYHVQVS